uniref:Uncharacterized protein n=1 Tax=Solanum tuberosum TaxID=4113 RepID=M1DU28_SOLTU
MSMLSKEKKKIDMMIIVVNSSDLHCFELFTPAVTLNIISLVVCDKLNRLLAKSALENGAYFCLENQFNKEIVKYLWQLVLREKIQREKSINGLEANGRNHMNVDEIYDNNIVRDEQQFGEKNMNVDTEEHNNNIHKAENDGVSTGKYKLKRKRGRKGIKQINEGESRRGVINKTGTRKNCAKWTVDLHSKFTKAVEQLGQGMISSKLHPYGTCRMLSGGDS